jgi:hypothetical protein
MYRIRKSAGGDRRSKDRRKELTEKDFKNLIETDFPDQRTYQDRRADPRRKTDPRKRR